MAEWPQWILVLTFFPFWSIAYIICIFIFSAKILVATDSEEIEIIDLINPKFKCQITDSRMGRSGCVGGLLQNVPLICGGCRGGSGEGRFINQFSYFIYGLNGPLGASAALLVLHLSL